MAEKLLVVRGDRVLFEDVGLALAPGGAVLLRGRNGAGKSTLLRVLAGLRRPEAGTISWNDEDIFADREGHAGRVAWVSHLDAVKPGLSCRENLAFGAGQEIDAALDRFDLGDLADLPARILSAGQKRRVALARAMLGGRVLWLLDEPTNGLDGGSIGRLGEVLAEHRAAGGMVIAATHVDLALPGAQTLRLGAA